MDISAIIWDGWGVLMNAKCGSIAQVWADLVDLPVEQVVQVFMGPELDQWQSDEIGKLEFMNFIAEKLNLKEEQKVALWYHKHDAYEYDEGLFTYIKELKKDGLTNALLTNVDRTTYEVMRFFSPDFFNTFDYVIPSYKYYIVKPDPALYRLALYMMDIKPQQAVFIDDTPEFVEAAENLGMRGIIFKDREQAIKDLDAVLSR